MVGVGSVRVNWSQEGDADLGGMWGVAGGKGSVVASHNQARADPQTRAERNKRRWHEEGEKVSTRGLWVHLSGKNQVPSHPMGLPETCLVLKQHSVTAVFVNWRKHPSHLSKPRPEGCSPSRGFAPPCSPSSPWVWGYLVHHRGILLGSHPCA